MSKQEDWETAVYTFLARQEHPSLKGERISKHLLCVTFRTPNWSNTCWFLSSTTDFLIYQRNEWRIQNYIKPSLFISLKIIPTSRVKQFLKENLASSAGLTELLFSQDPEIKELALLYYGV